MKCDKCGEEVTEWYTITKEYQSPGLITKQISKLTICSDCDREETHEV